MTNVLPPGSPLSPSGSDANVGVAVTLAPMTLLDADGHEVRLGSLWQQRHAVVVFVRHFGCIFCREQVGLLLRELDQIRAHGAELVVIGNGSPYFARTFREDLGGVGVGVSILVDSEQMAFRALPLQRGLKTVLKFGVVKRAMQAYRAGFRQGKTQGDVWQQGGVFVFGPHNREHYRYISTEAGDHPPVTAVLGALSAVAPAQSNVEPIDAAQANADHDRPQHSDINRAYAQKSLVAS